MPWVHVVVKAGCAEGVPCSACGPPSVGGKRARTCALRSGQRRDATIRLTRGDVPDQALVYRASPEGVLDAVFPVDRIRNCPASLQPFVEWFWALGANGEDLSRIAPNIAPRLASMAVHDLPLRQQPLPPPLSWVRHATGAVPRTLPALPDATATDAEEAAEAWAHPRAAFCPLRSLWFGPALAPRWSAVCGETSLLYVWGEPAAERPDGASLLAATEIALLLSDDASEDRLPAGNVARRALRRPRLVFGTAPPGPGCACVCESLTGWRPCRVSASGPRAPHLLAVEVGGSETVVHRASVRSVVERPPDGFFGPSTDLFLHGGNRV